mmetsp:Transcript_17677/g.41566  ORF Transcript_17677/g.41566 Transcript_17677/m.41566 type:complete len:203 (+) Transcript_17677:115-723(+)
MAERSTTIHAPGCLRLDLHLVFLSKDLLEVRNTVLDGPLGEVTTVHLKETPVGSRHQLRILHLLRPVAFGGLLEERDVLDVHAHRRGEIFEGLPSHLRLLSDALLVRVVLESLLDGQVLRHGANHGVVPTIKGGLHGGFEVLREDPHKLGSTSRPTFQDVRGHLTVRPALVCEEEFPQVPLFVCIGVQAGASHKAANLQVSW